MASETVDPIDWLLPPTLHSAVPPELHLRRTLRCLACALDPTLWTRHSVPHVLDPTILTLRSGLYARSPFAIDTILWTLRSGPYDLDIRLFSIRSGHYPLDPYTLNICYEENALDITLWSLRSGLYALEPTLRTLYFVLYSVLRDVDYVACCRRCCVLLTVVSAVLNAVSEL